jgi:hypothetical protein
MVLNCYKILIVIYFKYYRQRLIMTLYGNAALLLFYSLLLAYK